MDRFRLGDGRLGGCVVVEASTASGVTGGSEITVLRGSVVHPDWAALVALYNATDGPTWVDNENWLTDAPLGQWDGVTVNKDRRVTKLLLSETA